MSITCIAEAKRLVIKVGSALVTNNGENDLVVMSHEAFCRREAAVKLEMKLLAAERQITEGKLRDHEEVFSRLRKRVHGA